MRGRINSKKRRQKLARCIVKRLIILLMLGLISGFGCSSNTVFVRALKAPKWPVEGSRSIAVVAVLEGKHGREAQLT